jgi:hypothetical protein
MEEENGELGRVGTLDGALNSFGIPLGYLCWLISTYTFLAWLFSRLLMRLQP